jgi:hypothetical protein
LFQEFGAEHFQFTFAFRIIVEPWPIITIISMVTMAALVLTWVEAFTISTTMATTIGTMALVAQGLLEH